MHFIDRKSCFGGLAASLLVATGSLAACEEAPVTEPADAAPASRDEIQSTCGELGVIQGILSGAINATLDLPDRLLRCESMPRPDGEGVRIRFSADIEGERLTLIIALPSLRAGETGQDFKSNVTISVEGSGRFFSTPNLNTCWAIIATNQPLADDPTTYKVLGDLSCVAPLGEINGDGFVDVRQLHFSGIANWSSQ